FNRKPRPVSELLRWKATEFRSFILYLGPVVLKDIADVAIYEHFMLLHCGITIFVSKIYLSSSNIEFAGELLNTVVKHSRKLYGNDFLVYNVHYLIHLKDDVLAYGPLDNFSAFAFENYLGYLKQLVKSPTKPLQQICRRLMETRLSNFFIPAKPEGL
ncbi:hypothetical protein QE152_g41532, partial [Popillia japonica]